MKLLTVELAKIADQAIDAAILAGEMIARSRPRDRTQIRSWQPGVAGGDGSRPAQRSPDSRKAKTYD